MTTTIDDELALPVDLDAVGIYFVKASVRARFAASRRRSEEDACGFLAKCSAMRKMANVWRMWMSLGAKPASPSSPPAWVTCPLPQHVIGNEASALPVAVVSHGSACCEPRNVVCRLNPLNSSSARSARERTLIASSVESSIRSSSLRVPMMLEQVRSEQRDHEGCPSAHETAGRMKHSERTLSGVTVRERRDNGAPEGRVRPQCTLRTERRQAVPAAAGRTGRYCRWSLAGPIIAAPLQSYRITRITGGSKLL